MFRFCDGFDSYAATGDLIKKWDAVGTNWTWQSTAGINGGGSIQNTGASGNNITKLYRPVHNITSTITTYASFWIKFTAAPAANAPFFYVSNQFGSANIGFGVTTSGVIGYIASSISTIVASSTQICDNVWHHIEMAGTSSNAGQGRIWAYVDGVATSISNNSCGDNGSGYACYVVFRSTNANMTIDDFIVWDNEGSGITTSTMGIRTIETLRPSGAGSSAQFTPTGAASNYDCVDEVNHDSDTTYIASSTAGHKDLYAFGNLTGSPTTVTAAVVNNVAKVGTVAGLATIRPRVKVSSSEVSGTSVDLQSLSYYNRQEAFLTDPSTIAAWTVSGINSAEFGVELVS